MRHNSAGRLSFVSEIAVFTRCNLILSSTQNLVLLRICHTTVTKITFEMSSVLITKDFDLF